MYCISSFRSENSDSEEWVTVYNSSNTEWTLDGISANINYEFRVRAYNEYGYSNYSYSEKPFYLPETGGMYITLVLKTALINDDTSIDLVENNAILLLLLILI